VDDVKSNQHKEVLAANHGSVWETFGKHFENALYPAITSAK